MKIEQYNKVELTSGEWAYIVEILGDGEAFIADINKDGDTYTETIQRTDVKKVL